MEQYNVVLRIEKQPSETDHVALKNCIGPLCWDKAYINFNNGQNKEYSPYTKVQETLEWAKNNVVDKQSLIFIQEINGDPDETEKVASCMYFSEYNSFHISNGLYSESTIEDWRPYFENEEILNDKSLQNITVGFINHRQKHCKTFKAILKQLKSRGIERGNLLGMKLYWIFTIPTPENQHFSKIPFTDKQILAAPAYKVQKLPSSAILIQLTETIDPVGEDQAFIDKWFEVYNYFKSLS